LDVSHFNDKHFAGQHSSDNNYFSFLLHVCEQKEADHPVDHHMLSNKMKIDLKNFKAEREGDKSRGYVV
jgi:hypothetical protein